MQQYGSTDLTLLTAHFGISLLHNCTKIQYLLYSNCSKCPPPVAKQFGSWLHVSHVDFHGTTYAHSVNYLCRPG